MSNEILNKADIDILDKGILQILLTHGNTPYTDIAKELGVSGGTIHVRMKKMEEAGIVTGSKLTVDYSKLGFDVCAYIGVYLEKGSVYPNAKKELEKIDEIVEMHYTTGSYNILVKLICRDTNHLRNTLDRIQEIPGIQRTETFISLENSILREVKL